ncbi:RHS repeat domain-containing protein, partial [Burkholderia pseudomallei]|uniref:RHS repeat domain-containing protein n=5 Tax=Pseudomonadota TaxID=1224 RepID=UPI00358F0B61
VHDREGRLIAAIAGDGSVTAYEYDGSGRLVKTIGHINKLSAGQIEAFKANGPSASRPDAHPADSIARLFYDRAGRTIGALDGEGYLTRTIYDGAGQKVQEIAYANATAVAQRASGSLQALSDSAGTSASDRSVRHVYDQQGLLRFSIDALNH